MNRFFPPKQALDFAKRQTLRTLLGGVGVILFLCGSMVFAQNTSEPPRLRFVVPVIVDANVNQDNADDLAHETEGPIPSPTERPRIDMNPSFGTADSSPAYSPMRLTPAAPEQRLNAPRTASGSTVNNDVSQRTQTLRPVLPRPIIKRTPDLSNNTVPLNIPAPEPPAIPRQSIQNAPDRPRTVEPRFAAPLPNTVPNAVPIDREELARVLENGSELEAEARWREVLNHYETALRIFRNDESVMQRYRIARFHYDIGSRYHDSSYLGIVRGMGFVDALRFYENVIKTIQSEYVALPTWDSLFRHGITDLQIALSDPGFIRQAAPTASSEQVKQYLETVRKTADGWEIRHREDMRNGILRLAEIGQEQIALNPAMTLMEFTCGVVNSLDHYTSYLTPNLLNDQMSVISGNLVGLGVELGSDRDSLMILRVIQGSPAESGGLKDGDRILSVDGVSTRGKDTDEAANLLQGEEGTVVRLVIQSQGFGQKAREVRITRRQIEVPSVENVQMLNPYLGYIKLTGFQSKTATEMKQALAQLDRQGMRCLVLDMRKNPGGLFLLGVEVASLFINDGAIVRTKGRNNSGDVPYMAVKGETWDVPLIVLVDEETASAAEIVAGAIRDHGRGVIVGRRSYGKGTIQKIFPHIPDNAPGQGGLRLTVEKFYSPKGWPYSEVGVAPDVTVDVEKRWSLAKLVDGKLQIPLQSRTVSCDRNDPFIRQAMKTAETMIAPNTALRN